MSMLSTMNFQKSTGNNFQDLLRLKDGGSLKYGLKKTIFATNDRNWGSTAQNMKRLSKHEEN